MAPILVVNDLMGLAATFQAAVEAAGHCVEVAPDAAEALAWLHDSPNRFTKILCNVVMPGRDGLELICEDLRRDPLLRDLPAILVFGRSPMKEDDDWFRKHGVHYANSEPTAFVSTVNLNGTCQALAHFLASGREREE